MQKTAESRIDFNSAWWEYELYSVDILVSESSPSMLLRLSFDSPSIFKLKSSSIPKDYRRITEGLPKEG